jgi:hypothetical protein
MACNMASDWNKFDDPTPKDLALSHTAIRLSSIEDGQPGLHVDPVAAKRYTRKCDLIVIPMVSFAYLLEYSCPQTILQYITINI